MGGTISGSGIPLQNEGTDRVDRLTIGDLISGTMRTMDTNRQAVTLYVALLTVVGTAYEWGLNTGISLLPTLTDELADRIFSMGVVEAGIALAVVGFILLTLVANYLLFEAMLNRRGPRGRRDEPFRLLAFIGLTILTYLGIMLGLVLLIVPALIIGARWSIAPAFLINRRCGIGESLSQSWNAVRGNTTPIILTFLLGLFGLLLLSGLAGAGEWFSSSDEQPGFVSILAGQIVSSLGAALQGAFAVYIFSRLVGITDDLGEVFD